MRSRQCLFYLPSVIFYEFFFGKYAMMGEELIELLVFEGISFLFEILAVNF